MFSTKNFEFKTLSFYDSFFLDTTTPMNLGSVRGILVAIPGARKNSSLHLSSRVTERHVFGCVASLAVARQESRESAKLTNTPGNMLVINRNS